MKRWIVSGSFLFGAGALITSYRNLHDLEIQMGAQNQRFFEPLSWITSRLTDYSESHLHPKKDDADCPKQKPDAGRDRVTL